MGLSYTNGMIGHNEKTLGKAGIKQEQGVQLVKSLQLLLVHTCRCTSEQTKEEQSSRKELRGGVYCCATLQPAIGGESMLNP